MGNLASNNVKPEKSNDQIITPNCILCLKEFSEFNETILEVQCVKCNIFVHSQCFREYMDRLKINYGKCPYCNSIGTMATASSLSIPHV